MSTIIDLATFKFDESSLISSIAKTKQALIELKAQQTVNNNDYKTYQKTIDEQVAKQKLLTAAGQENTKEYKDNATALAANKQAQLSILQSNTVLANNIATVNNELKNQNTALLGNGQAVSGSKTAYKNLNDEMNRLKSEAKDLGAELFILEREGKKGTAEYTNLEKKFKETSESANVLNDSFKEIDASVGDNNRNVGDYKEQIKSAFQEMNIFNGGLGGFLARSQEAGGVGKLVSGSFAQISTAVRGASSALLSNPIGIIIAGIVGAFAGFKAVLDYNKAISEASKLTEQLTGTTGATANAIRNNAEAFSETFGGEFKENLRTADELVNDFGISYDEAFQIMTDATIRGANANGEFGESINEYGVFFKKAGFSAQEFANVLNSGVELGVYSDKLPDAIKEIDLSLREQTKATKEALVGAFGATFSNDVLARINSGATSTKDAMAEIAKEAERTNLTQVQLATLTADVARGAGEDVGGIAVVFKALNQSINANKKPLTELQKATLEVANANLELKNAKDRALNSKDIVAFSQGFSNIGKSIKIGFYNGLASVREFFGTFGELNTKLIIAFKDFVFSIPNLFNKNFGIVKKSFSDFIQNFVTGGSLIKNALTGNFDGVQEDFAKIKKSFLNIGGDIKNSAKSITGDIKNTISKSISDTSKMLDDKKAKLLAQSEFEAELTKKEANKGQSPEDVKENDDAKKQAIKDAEDKLKAKKELLKKELEDQKTNALSLANTEIENAKIALAQYLDANKSKLTDAKRLTADLIAEENKRLDAVLEKNRDILTGETRVKNEQLTAEIKALNDKKVLSESEKLNLADLNLQKKNLQADYLLKDKQLIEASEVVKKEIGAKYATQTAEELKIKQAQEFQLKLQKLEEQGATEYQLQVAKIDNETALALQKFNDKSDLEFQAGVQKRLEQDTLISEEQAVKEELNAQLQAAKDENEKIRIQNLLDGINLVEQNAANKKAEINQIVETKKRSDAAQTFGQIADLLGKETTVGKAAALAQATLSGINAVQNAYSTAQKSPITAAFPGYPIVQAGLAGAFSAVQIGKIAGFATGGIITDGVPISRRNGDDVLITAKRGEVILNDTQQAMLGGSRTFARVGVPGFATGGVVGSQLSSVQKSITNSIDMSALAETIGQAVFDGANMGTASGSESGIVGLSNNRQIANNANF